MLRPIQGSLYIHFNTILRIFNFSLLRFHRKLTLPPQNVIKFCNQIKASCHIRRLELEITKTTAMEEEQYASSRLLIYDFDKHGPMPTKQQLNAAGHLTNAFFSTPFLPFRENSLIISEVLPHYLSYTLKWVKLNATKNLTFFSSVVNELSDSVAFINAATGAVTAKRSTSFMKTLPYGIVALFDSYYFITSSGQPRAFAVSLCSGIQRQNIAWKEKQKCVSAKTWL